MLVRKVEEIIEPVLKREGIEIVDIEFKPRKGGSVLTVYIDKEGGIDLETCKQVSELISPILDVYDLIKSRYYLEVSSPGIERPLRKVKDFKRYVGSEVSVNTFNKIEGRRRFKGLLEKANENSIVIRVDSEEYEIPYPEISKANLVVEIEF